MDNETLHILWSAGLTLIGAFLMWSWRDLHNQVQHKADKEEVAGLREDIRCWQEQQEEMHRENRTRLDRILEAMAAVRQLNRQDER